MSSSRNLNFLAWQAFSITAGALLTAVTINVFLVPHKLVTGGVSGLALVIYYVMPLVPIWGWIVLLNAPLFIGGLLLLGRNFLAGSLYGTIVLTIFVYATEGIVNSPVLQNPLLASAFGGVLSGFGIGLTLRANGSLGGTDILGAMGRKVFSLNIGHVVFGANALIVLVSAGIYGAEIAALALVNIFVEGMLIDKTIRGINISKALFIITAKPQEIADEIIKKVGRGVTFLHGQGAFYGNERKVLYCVVNLRQLSRVKLAIQGIDPSAFVSVADVSEVMGQGFRPTPF